MRAWARGASYTAGVSVSPLRFPVLLLVYIGGFGLVFSTVLRGVYHAVNDWLALATAAAVHALLAPFVNTRLDGTFVSYDGFPVEIVGECVGVYEVVIFSACVLAYPASLRAKLIGLPLGTLAILVFNLVRIIGLLIVGRHQPEFFDFFHLYFWQGTLVLLVAAVWLAWLQLIVRR